jgi:pimeloyl-ACP methyl ester carboxylesterase
MSELFANEMSELFANEMSEHTVTVRGVRLRILDSGEPQHPDNAPALLFLHGLRDVAWALMPIAQPFADRYRIVLPDLRGHGGSDNPGAYSMEHFLIDLHRVITDHVGRPVWIVGHSLGGQIASRYAAVFPEQVLGMVLIEGLGPPSFPVSDDPAGWIRGYRERMLSRFGEPTPGRDLQSVENAASRLLANNPRLRPETAQALAAHATHRDPQGRLQWSFDSHAASVFVNPGVGEGERFWSLVRCPTLVISGDLAHEYWRTQFGQLPGFDGRYAPGEMAARARLFPRGEHCTFHHSGHMVHYDEPDRLITVISEFIARQSRQD